MIGFYNVEHKLVIDMLIRRNETKEDDLVEVLKLERKHLRALIQKLKEDKFINVRPIMETEDGKSTRRNYYSINFRMFINVVKYKLDHMRIKLEKDERDSTSMAGFLCLSCGKQFAALELGQIISKSLDGKLRCSYCDGDVDEDPNARPKEDSKLIMKKFNDQTNPIYDLLQETEKIKLTFFETDRNNLTATSDSGHVGTSNGATLSTNTPNGTNPVDPHNPNSIPGTSVQDSYAIKIVGLEERDKADQRNNKSHIDPEVEALLLREENSANPTTNAIYSSHEEDDQENSVPNIRVGTTSVPITAISDEHVLQMDSKQREEYQRIMQQLYSFLYE